MKMTKERFWVVGGDYTCMSFTSLKDGSQQVVGPFDDRAQAQAAWLQLSEESRSRATARYAITSEQVRLPH
jgi:hypothetical protein